MLARVVSQTLNVRAAASANAAILATLPRGTVVSLRPGTPTTKRWVAIDHGGGVGHVARRFLAQSPDAPLVAVPAPRLSQIDTALWDATSRYDAITYRLGCKARLVAAGLQFSGSDVAGQPCSGTTVDCSGWVSGLFQLLAAATNSAGGPTIFGKAATNRFANHSDGQISGVGGATGQLWSGTDIDSLALRSGLMFGLNAGEYDWEGTDRSFGIDHIVMGVKGPDGYYITQSSSSGGGVNRVAWPVWRQQWRALFDAFNVHCVDPLAMGQWTPAIAAPAGELEAADQLAAPPG